MFTFVRKKKYHERKQEIENLKNQNRQLEKNFLEEVLELLEAYEKKLSEKDGQINSWEEKARALRKIEELRRMIKDKTDHSNKLSGQVVNLETRRNELERQNNNLREELNQEQNLRQT